MHPVLGMPEILERILVAYGSDDLNSRRNILTTCTRVNEPWNAIISRSPRIRALTWRYSLYIPKRRPIDDPFLPIKRYLEDKFLLMSKAITRHRPTRFRIKNFVRLYFGPGSGEQDCGMLFRDEWNVETLRISVFGYSLAIWNERRGRAWRRLAREELRGKENITVDRLEKIVCDAMLLAMLEFRISLQFYVSPPFPIYDGVGQSSQSPNTFCTYPLSLVRPPIDRRLLPLFSDI